MTPTGRMPDFLKSPAVKKLWAVTLEEHRTGSLIVEALNREEAENLAAGQDLDDWEDLDPNIGSSSSCSVRPRPLSDQEISELHEKELIMVTDDEGIEVSEYRKQIGIPAVQL